MPLKFYCILLTSAYLNLIALPSNAEEPHPCFSCAKPFTAYEQCKDQNSKVVDFSGLCGRGCAGSSRSCNHQTLRNGADIECQFFSQDSCSREAVGSWTVLQCDEQSEKCSCPPSTSHVPLEDHVVITAYPFECPCALPTEYRTVWDIRIKNATWRDVSIVSKSSGGQWCGQFRLTGSSPDTQLRYDCPKHERVEEGREISLEICTREHTVRYRFNLPFSDNITSHGRSVQSWEPLIALHQHRGDRLVYDIQRSPPDLNISQYDVALVRFESQNCSGVHHVIPGSERRLKELPSKDDHYPDVFRREFDLPEEAGYISLVVQPDGGHETFSVCIKHLGKNTAEIAIIASVLALILVLAIGAIVWRKMFYKPAEPAVVEVLVLYNSNVGLARHVAHQLESHCLVLTRLDVVDIPRASGGMDPVEWLTSELERCHTVLLLVFPEDTAPSIYPRLYPAAVHHLMLDAGRKRVVIGHAGGAACAPLPKLPSARVCRLPAQLALMARAVRGAAWLGRGCLDARELARRLTTSPGGLQLADMLARPAEVPPPEAAPLPVNDADAKLPPLLLPQPPPRNEHQMAPHIDSTDVILDQLDSNGKISPPVVGDDSDSDDGIEWH